MRNRKRRAGRWLAGILAWIMIVTMMPASAFSGGLRANAASEASESTVAVDFTAQQEGTFLFAPKFGESVSSNLAESYGYVDKVTNGVSALDVLVRAHEIAFEDAFTVNDKGDYLVVSESGSIEKMFGTDTTTVGFAINGGFPNDGTKKDGEYNGTDVAQSAVKNGDLVEFFFYQDTETYLDNIVWFCKDGSAVSSITAKPGDKVALKLMGVSYVYDAGKFENGVAMRTEGGTAICGMQLAWVDAETGAVTNIEGCTTDSKDGTVTLAIPETAGTYYLTTTGTDDSDNYSIMSLTKVVSDPNYNPVTAVSCDLNSLTVASLTGDAKVLSPAFDANVTEYSLPVQEYSANAMDTSFKVQFAQKDSTAAVEVKHNGVAISAGGGGWYICNSTNVLKPGIKNKLTVKVTASDGNTKTYTVVIPMKDAGGNPPPSAELNSVVFSLDEAGKQKIKMTPAFNSGTTEYKLELYDYQMPSSNRDVVAYCTQTLGAGVTSKYFFYTEYLGAMAGSSGYNGGNTELTLTANGTIAILRSRFCDPFKSTGGSNNQRHKIVVTAGEGDSLETKEYFFHTIAYPTLKSLFIDGGNVDNFAANKFEYNIAVPAGTTAVNVTPTASDIGTASTTKYTIYRNGDTTKADIASTKTFPLNAEGITTISLVVEDKGGLTSTYTVKVRKAPPAQQAMDAIAAAYAQKGIGTDPWVAADMAAYAKAFPDKAKLSDEQKQAYLATLVPKMISATKPGDLAKYIIALRSMGYDARKVVNANGETIDIVKKLTDMVDDTANAAVTNMYTLPYVLIALQQGSNYATQAQIDYLKNAAVASKESWLKDNGGIDAIPPMVLALAPYSNEAAVKTVLNDAVAFIKSKQTATGAVGNANSTGIAIAGIAAVGENPADVKAESGKSLIDGLMTQVSATGDGFVFGASTANNAMATEQGFRGLVAWALQTQAEPKGRVFDFAAMPMNSTDIHTLCSVQFSVTPADAVVEVKKEGAAQSGVGSNRYVLAAGAYTYTATKAGYQTATGSFAVTNDDIAAQKEKTIDVGALTPEPGKEEPNLNITVKVLTHDGDACGGKWTYKHNQDKYKEIASATVAVRSGASAFDAFDQAMRQKNISYTEKDGYISAIAGDAEFGHGSGNSGWQYMADGAMPTVGCREYGLTANAELIWFYTDDYTRETASGGGTGGASGEKPTEDVYKLTAEYLKKLADAHTMQVGSVGGEWMLIGLARSGALTEKQAADYYVNLETYIKKNINVNGQLSESKSTENARVILALAAIGKDVTNVAGHNLLAGLTDMGYVKNQGVNGLIWALIAFDSHKYDIPAGGDVTKESLIQAILDARHTDGGWSLSETKTEPSDVDVTAMALCALAPYGGSSGNSKVRDVIAKGVELLSGMQKADGGYASGGSVNSESCAQVILALTALGINPATDSRFIKNGNSVMDALQGFYVEGGGFRHIAGGERNGMATEQGYCALVAYDRMQKGISALYDMKDVALGNAGTPTKPSQPAQPPKPSQPAQPSQPAKPAEPAQPAQPSQPEAPKNEMPTEKVSAAVSQIEEAAPQAIIRVEMNGATVVPVEILVAAKGKDANIRLDMGGYAWTINGKDIQAAGLKAINLQVAMDTKTIPAAAVKKVAGSNPTMQLTLAHDGDFGFKASLTLNVGKANAGRFGNLFYYDNAGKMTYMNAGRISADGAVSLAFTHASEYLIVMSEKDMAPAGGTQMAAPMTGGQDSQAPYAALLLASAACMAALCRRRRGAVR